MLNIIRGVVNIGLGGLCMFLGIIQVQRGIEERNKQKEVDVDLHVTFDDIKSIPKRDFEDLPEKI